MRYIEIEIKYFYIDKKCAISYNRVIMLAFPKKDGGKNGSQLQQIMETNDR